MGRGEFMVITRRIEQFKANIQVRLDHPFHLIKNLFGHRKLRRRGLKKNPSQLKMLSRAQSLHRDEGPLGLTEGHLEKLPFSPFMQI
jgi:IS5 family transposase